MSINAEKNNFTLVSPFSESPLAMPRMTWRTGARIGECLPPDHQSKGDLAFTLSLSLVLISSGAILMYFSAFLFPLGDRLFK